MMDKKILWRTIHAGFLICIGLFGAGSFLGIHDLRLLHVFAAFAVLFLLTAFCSLSLRGRCLFFAGMFLVLLGTGAAAREFTFSFWQSYIFWLVGRPSWNSEWMAGYELMQTVFFAMFCYAVQLVMERSFRFKAAAMGAVFLVLIYCLLARRPLSHASVALMLCYGAILYVEWTQIHWKKEKEKGIQDYMLWLLPFFAVYFFLMLLPKVPEKPYEWRFVKTVCSQIKESFLKFTTNYLNGNGEDFNLSLSGFSESGRLTGRNEERQEELMTVESESGPVFNIYLTGKVYDTFDGRQWQQKSRDIPGERYIDTAETLASVRRYDRKHQEDYLMNRDIKIRYKYFRTRFLFAPLKMRRPGVGRREPEVKEAGGSLCFDRRKGYGTEYELSFFQLNTGQENFRRFLEEASVGEENPETFSEFFEISQGITGRKLTAEDIEKYRQEIFEAYGEQGVLTHGVEEYLDTITEGAKTQAERLKMIEAELASYTYTRTPGELPETVKSSGDFLNYFLLESREGYCTYFATAFVLLARAEGLPARYVQGFCVPVGSREETRVYSNMAHAWPEVYFEGAGWIPFEPTPGYSGMRYTSWNVKRTGTEAAGNADSQEAEDTETEEEEQLLGEDWPESSEDLAKRDRQRNFWRIFSLAGAWMISIILVLFLVNRLFVRFGYGRMDRIGKFKTEVYRNMRILAFMGIKREPEETLEEFRRRAGELLGEEEVLLFLERYEAFYYGDKAVEADMLEEVRKQQKKLLEFLRRRRKWGYACYRLFSIHRNGSI